MQQEGQERTGLPTVSSVEKIAGIDGRLAKILMKIGEDPLGERHTHADSAAQPDLSLTLSLCQKMPEIGVILACFYWIFQARRKTPQNLSACAVVVSIMGYRTLKSLASAVLPQAQTQYPGERRHHNLSASHHSGNVPS